MAGSYCCRPLQQCRGLGLGLSLHQLICTMPGLQETCPPFGLHIPTMAAAASCSSCIVVDADSAMCSQTCAKQYKTAGELEVHLSSYDHHHKKVLRLPQICTPCLAWSSTS